ncbi:hypothetical protein Rhopal_005281-T1 [Rhodotorula paludigena]|uniref:Uncharacterized protein n=1 Tax=Rhodotorula paludigena TaxID=86838 RepID=A0AAV5GHW5_9BASI|nr:hypothetical protein Rhopal_005281-T1 [Rhodotorula paludigena]
MLSRFAPGLRAATLRPARVAPSLSAAPPRLPLLYRTYADTSRPNTSEGHGVGTTSTSHQTVMPKTPPEPTPFFARKMIGLEVTPLMAFIGTIVVVALGFLGKNLITEDSIQHRHGVIDDKALKEAVNSDGHDSGK